MPHRRTRRTARKDLKGFKTSYREFLQKDDITSLADKRQKLFESFTAKNARNEHCGKIIDVCGCLVGVIYSVFRYMVDLRERDNT